MVTNPVSMEVGVHGVVSGILSMPKTAFACLVLAHGAGAGMYHPFMNAVAEGLGTRGMATLRYQFPYMQRGSRRPDTAAVAQAAVRKAVAAAARLAPDLPLLAGGKSYGGRMTSQAQAEEPLPGVVGLVFLGFPLHPAGKPSNGRAHHLAAVRVPMLFLQGTRDALAEQHLLAATMAHMPLATLKFFEQADHAFHVPARSAQTDRQVLEIMLDGLADWGRSLCR